MMDVYMIGTLIVSFILVAGFLHWCGKVVEDGGDTR